MKTSVAFVIVFSGRGQERKRDKEKKRLMYTYLPQMHMLSFGAMFFTTPFQQSLLQHRFNTTSVTPSFVALLQHCLCDIIFYSIASTLLFAL
jgi:hypothetical protein